MNPDLDSEARIARFVESFYRKILADSELAPIFLDVAAVDLKVHLPHIRDYWCKLLLGDDRYRRHTMNIHRELHLKQSLTPANFEAWLALFNATADEGYRGPHTDRARRVAAAIAGNMLGAIQGR
ncbi:MAG: hemoglobin [Halieaceae bacterium]|jgi:hemoglobin